MIRAARPADVMGIMAVFREGYERSPHRATARLDEDYARKEVLLKSMMYHGHKTMLGTNVIVADRDGKIVGVHIGVKQRVGVISTALYATDLLFILSKDASPFAAVAMAKKFEAWAATDPRIIMVKPGVNSDVDDWHMGQRFYEQLGYEQDGAIMRKPLSRERMAA